MHVYTEIATGVDADLVGVGSLKLGVAYPPGRYARNYKIPRSAPDMR